MANFPHGFDDRWFPSQAHADYIERFWNQKHGGMLHFAKAEQHGSGWLVAIYDSTDSDEFGGIISDYLPGNYHP